MHGRFNRLILTALTAMMLTLIIGCSQPNDVLAPVSTSRIVLEPERLPTLPEDMYYHLWVIDTAQMAYSIGGFLWNSAEFKFYDLDSNLIDSLWTVDYDILDPFYRFISVSVEHRDDMPTGSVLPKSSIGPVMLQDTLYSTDIRPMKMIFPLDMWLGYGFFCVETPSDSNSNTNDVNGLWFAEYIYDSLGWSDTTNVRLTISNALPRPLLIDVLLMDSSYYRCDSFHRYKKDSCLPGYFNEITEEEYVPDSIHVILPSGDTVFVDVIILDTLDADTTVVICSTDDCDTLPVSALSTTTDSMYVNYIKVITDSNYMINDSLVLDTFVHTYVEFDYIAPMVNTGRVVRYDTVTIYRDYDAATDTWLTQKDSVFQIMPFTGYDHDLTFTRRDSFIIVDKFIPSFDESPDLSDAGNDFMPEYDKKWHYKGWLLSSDLSPAAAFGKLTSPNWAPFFLSSEIAPLGGSMISTGTFKRFNGPDDDNAFTDNHRVPPVPGEDFLLNLPDGVSSITACNSGGTIGRVLITLEPDNFASDSTNFPLILFVKELPPCFLCTFQGEHTQRTLSFDMKNWSSTVTETGAGFPMIHVKYIRE